MTFLRFSVNEYINHAGAGAHISMQAHAGAQTVMFELRARHFFNILLNHRLFA